MSVRVCHAGSPTDHCLDVTPPPPAPPASLRSELTLQDPSTQQPRLEWPRAHTQQAAGAAGVPPHGSWPDCKTPALASAGTPVQVPLLTSILDGSCEWCFANHPASNAWSRYYLLLTDLSSHLKGQQLVSGRPPASGHTEKAP